MSAVETDKGTVSQPFQAYRKAVDLWRAGQREVAVAMLQEVYEGKHGPLGPGMGQKALFRLLVFAPAISWELAEQLSQRAVEDFPTEAAGYRHLGEALLRQDRYEDAEAALLQAVELDKEDEDSRLLLTMARRRLNPGEGSRRRPRTWPDRQQLFEDPRRLLEKYLLRGYPAEPFVTSGTCFMTLGSCFAQNLARHLAAEGFTVHDEPIGEEVNSTYANRYLLKWIEQGPVDGPTGVVDEVFGHQRRMRLRRALVAADALVLTLGVAPCFFDQQTGEFAFSALKSPTGQQYLEQNCVMRTTSVAENVANLHEIVDTAARIAGRPHKVVFTLSPVALAGTTEFYSAVIADCLSKSTLRLACQEVIEARPQIIYWPSFEIVRWLGVHYTRPDAPVFGAEDGNTRHVSNWLVQLIVQLFIERHRGQPQS